MRSSGATREAEEGRFETCPYEFDATGLVRYETWGAGGARLIVQPPPVRLRDDPPSGRMSVSPHVKGQATDAGASGRISRAPLFALCSFARPACDARPSTRLRLLRMSGTAGAPPRALGMAGRSPQGADPADEARMAVSAGLENPAYGQRRVGKPGLPGGPAVHAWRRALRTVIGGEETGRPSQQVAFDPAQDRRVAA